MALNGTRNNAHQFKEALAAATIFEIKRAAPNAPKAMPFMFPRRILRLSFRHLTTLPKLLQGTPPNIPAKSRQQILSKAQEALTEYLHTTRSLPFVYAEQIARNSTHSLSGIISRIDSTPSTFSRKFSKFLRYDPINELEFFYESIGIDHADLKSFLPSNKFFISEECDVFEVACALFKFGFPWKRLGKLYKDEVSVFRMNPGELSERLLHLKSWGFDTATIIGICAVFPQVLCGGSTSGDVGLLLDDLKRILLRFDLASFPERNDETWTEVCRKVKLFYDMGCKKGKVGKMVSNCKSIFIDYSEEVLAQKMEYFSRLGVGRRNVAMLILEYPEILGFDSDTSDFSVVGFLKHFGLSDRELKSITQMYPYIVGRNKIANLPHVMRALDLHNWLFDQLKKGRYNILVSYVLKDPGEDVDELYKEGLEKIRFARLPAHTMTKLKFIHGIGFGENDLTIKLLPSLHGTGSALQDRFDCFVELGADFSMLCRIISRTPKILNQKPDVIIDKVDFLFNEIGLSISSLYQFPAYMNFDLENRIKPRYRFHVWLAERGVSTKVFSLANIVASSEKTFIARSTRIHPAAPKHYLECFFPFR